MKYTSNHNFKLPAPSDTIDVEVLNENFINIDALIKTLESAKADKNSPSFTGAPTAPTASGSTNSTQIATTAFVQGLIKGIQTALSGKANKNSPSFTGTPKSPTPPSSDISTRIATTAFVQNLVQAVDKKISELVSSTLDSTYAMLLFDKDNISTCSNIDSFGITYSQYQNGTYKTDIVQVGNNAQLPNKSNAPVFLVSWAAESGDESEIYNVQAVIYPDGTVYGRHRYLWSISSGIVSKLSWNDWSTDNNYIYYNPKDHFVKE